MRILLKEALNLEIMSGVMSLMLYILKFAMVIQGLGALALSFTFVPTYGWTKGFGTASSMLYQVFVMLGLIC